MEANQERKMVTSNWILPFPQKVYNMLKFCEEQGREDIVSWVNDGTAFKVHNLGDFEQDLLPMFFNTSKYYTFTRALYSHGFTCVRMGRQTGIYSHTNFNRKDPLSPSQVKRVLIKKGSRKVATLNQDTVPNPFFGTLDTHSSSAKPAISNDGQQICQFPPPILEGTRREDGIHAHGFTCVRKARQTDVYSHPSFNPNNPLSPPQIQREMKNESRRQTEPNRHTVSDPLFVEALSCQTSNLWPDVGRSNSQHLCQFPSFIDEMKPREFYNDGTTTVFGREYHAVDASEEVASHRLTSLPIKILPLLLPSSGSESSFPTPAGSTVRNPTASLVQTTVARSNGATNDEDPVQRERQSSSFHPSDNNLAMQPNLESRPHCSSGI